MDAMMDAPRKRYVNRHEDSEVVHFSISMDAEAVHILRAYGQPGRRGLGKFIAKLLYEERARREERQRLKTFLDAETTTALARED